MLDSHTVKSNFFLVWIFANSVGLALGWAGGESIGELYPSFVWLAFGLPVWGMRLLALKYLGWSSQINPIELMIWVSAEFIGYVFSLGFWENGYTWHTVGSIFGSLGGASMWLQLWMIRQTRAPRRRWIFFALGWGFAGFLLATVFWTIGLLIANEAYLLAKDLAFPTMVWAGGGALVGLWIGLGTYLPFLAFRRK